MDRTRHRRVPLIGITMGDPAGVGPELCLRALMSSRVRACCVPLVFGDASILRRVARHLHWPEPRNILSLAEWEKGAHPTRAGIIHCEENAGLSDVRPGVVQPKCGQAAYRYIQIAARHAIRGRVHAISTAPIHKQAFRAAGVRFAGHTEFLSRLTHTRRLCMTFYSHKLIVSLVTAHSPLRSVANALSVSRMVDVIRLTVAFLRRLGIPKPHIGVCGINPHAGEGGWLGNEEIRVIRPAIETARGQGICVEGPLPPDTAFLASPRQHVHAYVAMYHDQGLIPFKMLAFKTGVHVTLGLPIVRTSPDHGTAFDVAWKGIASAESLIQSVLLAAKLALQPPAHFPR